jgi:hypothetical protein
MGRFCLSQSVADEDYPTGPLGAVVEGGGRAELHVRPCAAAAAHLHLVPLPSDAILGVCAPARICSCIYGSLTQ